MSEIERIAITMAQQGWRGIYNDEAMANLARNQCAPSIRSVIKALRASGYEIVLKDPDENMLNAARDWSVDKYGRGVGNDGAEGCYKAMLNAGKLDVGV